ncbi:hypothetical protein SGL43_07205 [Streptomyces globisporus]|uniref:Tat pathway signal sequence domain protein n=1 Tax=Streptomyces globisporus TaxID=1908 RepID=A0ABM9H8Z2_STRGL|nr:hypothetical protein DER30_3744 [Streptomyces sp. HB202]CAH9420148.1 hypothetical protein SGL43_07205 [Streptomyces globisporus]
MARPRLRRLASPAVRRLRGLQHDQPEGPGGSPLKDKKAWVTAVVFPAIMVIVATAVPGGWGWFSGLFAEPPSLKAYSSGPDGCVPRYSVQSLSELKAKPDALRAEGVPVADPQWGEVVSAPLTLQAKTNQSIVVTGVRVDVITSKPVPSTGQVIDASDCGSGIDVRPFDVDLASQPVAVKPAVTKGADGSQKRGPGFPFKVSSDDPEQLVLMFPSVQGDVRFSITVDWVSEGKPGNVKLDNGGAGYRVMGLGGLPRHPYSTLFKRPTP